MSTITLTFGDCGENHVGMQKIGQMSEEGFDYSFLKDYFGILIDLELKCEFVDLSRDDEKACIIIIRNGIDDILSGIDSNSDALFEEQKSLPLISLKTNIPKRTIEGIIRDVFQKYDLIPLGDESSNSQMLLILDF